MVDKTPPARSSRERIKTLAQAALNADVTVDQFDTLLTGMNDTLTDLNKTMSGMEGTLEYFEQTLQIFNETLSRIDELAPRLNTVVDGLEGIVERVERIVGLSEVVMSPLMTSKPMSHNAWRTSRCPATWCSSTNSRVTPAARSSSGYSITDRCW
jgi:hypothetical protein